jgi:hypothetical protein
VVLADDEDDPLALLENHQDLPFREDDNGDYYMGGVGRGLGLGVFSSFDNNIPSLSLHR